jgi:hypothetical protein
MEYCLGDTDGSATIWTADPNTDVDGDGSLDAVGLDFDGDGLLDDAMADLDGDGLADHAVLDVDNDSHGEAFFTDDGTGTWAVSVDRAGQLRWFGLDGVEHFGGQEHSDPGIGGSGPLVDVDGDGQTDDRLTDTDGDGLADRALSGDVAYVDTDGDGRWDVKLADSDGDGKADAATEL